MTTMSKFVPIFARFRVLANYKLIQTFNKRQIISDTSYNSTSGYRYYGVEKKDNSLTEVKSKEVGTPLTFEQVKETTKTASYLGVILIGVGVTGVIFYAVFRELFSSKSPNSVYSKALNKCCKEPRVLNALGEPIKGFGEETRRGRRRHVSHVFYEKEGVNYLRMKFYIQGSRKRGTVHLEMKEDECGKFEYRYLFVQMDDYPGDTIILEDNRYDVPKTVDVNLPDIV